MEKILVTGCVGFIGSHLCESLCKNKNNIIIGIDNFDDYYDVSQKKENLRILQNYENFKFYQEDIRTSNIIVKEKPAKIVHLAAMAGIRNSINNPELYANVNINGFINIAEQAKKIGIKLLIYASSSSVYGLNKNTILKMIQLKLVIVHMHLVN